MSAFIRYSLIGLAAAACCFARSAVDIVTGSRAHPVEKLAARELGAYLGRIYPGTEFTLTERAAPGRLTILVGAKPTAKLSKPESFRVSHSGKTGFVAGADPRGILYGVYALLEKLGCGFYLSGDALPQPRKEPFSFDAWDLEDSPVFADRIVFDWHNFLSSASTWELEDWRRYIDQSAKMRFNTVMVHAYGNNPMFTYEFNGLRKPVGYLATTASGRDWGTQHVNDVRRLIGGELFKDAVFGASVAKVPEAERAPAAMSLMKSVFAHAASRGMHVTFALDVDTESANPQEIIGTLPASARITSGKYQLANPDTPEGYAFYKTQARELMATYPQIDRLAVWFRHDRTPWRNIQLAEFPADWRREFEALHAAPGDASMFAMAKLIKAFGRALRETGHANVELATGSWRLDFLEGADRFFPREVTILPLDWSTVIDTPAGQKQIKAVRSGRKLLPIVWAHHDDRTYMGRSYTPFVNFSTLIKNSGGSGFGIIHWTTRPLDLYFKSLAAQVWSFTQDQPVHEACDAMGARMGVSSDYLLSWVTEAPMFGRETSNRFMDVRLKDPEVTVAKIRARLKMLSDASGYFGDYERFMLAFFESQLAFERAEELFQKGDLAGARREIAKSNPEEVIRLYVKAAQNGKISRGEEALVVSLNLRWRPYILSLRQALGMEPIRLAIGTVQKEPLAQGAGTNTFFVDEQGRFMKVQDALDGTPKLLPIGGHKLAPGLHMVEVRDARGRVTTQTIAH